MAESGCLRDLAVQNLEVGSKINVSGLTTINGGLAHETVVSVDGAQTDTSSSRIITAAINHNIDLSAETDARDRVIVVIHAMANGQYIRLPEATTVNGGKHIRVIFGIAVTNAFAVGFLTTNIIGGATAVGDTDEANAPTDTATAIADVGDTFKSVRFDLDDAGLAGGTGGTVLDFYYTGSANLVVYRGSLISEVDDPTLATHFSTTAANA